MKKPKYRKINIQIKLLSKLNIKSYLSCFFAATGIVLFSQEVLAFNLEAGIKGALDPLKAGIKGHWGTGLAICGTLAALIGEGDLRARSVRAGLGCAAAGAVIVGVWATTPS